MLRIPRLVAATVCAAALGAAPASAQTLPDGFGWEHVVAGPFSGDPVGLAFLPDERILLVERSSGIVRLVAVDSAAADSIHTVPGVESVHPERGLLGVAVDPQWPTRPYVYVYYTHVSGFQHVTMYTATGDLSDPASTSLSLGSPYRVIDDIRDVNGIHNAGTIRFGPDGMLYVSVGDDQIGCLAQDLTELSGSLLRLDVSALPDSGSGPPAKAVITPGDNPFPGPDENERLIYAWGLRNPYRFNIDAPTGEIFIADVGSAYFEEVNHIDPAGYTGSNFAWPRYESSRELFCCPGCGVGNVFTDPIHDLEHGLDLISMVSGPVMRDVPGSSVAFPPSYDGDYFYFEIFSGDLRRLTGSGTSWALAPPAPGQPDSLVWGTGFGGASDALLGPDGALWFVCLGSGLSPGLYRIVRTAPTSVEPFAAGGAPRLAIAPNPGVGAAVTSFRVSLGGAARAELFVHDVAGRVVWRSGLPEDRRTAVVGWDGRLASGARAAAGVYLVRLVEDGRVTARGKLTRLR